MFGFLKRLFRKEPPRRGVLVFREEAFDARGEPRGAWIAGVLEDVRVLEASRAGGMVRLLCECDRFEPLERGAQPPLYLPRLTVSRGPDGETRTVEFRRAGTT